jgi:hypothetical protein
MEFRVIPSTVPMSAEEWVRAKNAPVSELPQLSDQQLAEAKQLSMPEEEYKRFRVLLRRYVLERQQMQGEAFGMYIRSLIEPLGERYALSLVSRRGSPLGWRFTIRDVEKGVCEFQSSFEVVAALTEGKATEEELRNFRTELLDELGHEMELGAAG